MIKLWDFQLMIKSLQKGLFLYCKISFVVGNVWNSICFFTKQRLVKSLKLESKVQIYQSYNLYIFLSFNLSIYVSIFHLSMFLSLFYLSFNLSIFQSIYLSIFLSFNLSIFQSFFLSIVLSFMSFNLSTLKSLSILIFISQIFLIIYVS